MEISELHQDHGRDAPPMTARQRFIVVLLLGASFLLSADFSILNVALPEVGQAIGLKVNEFPWIATSFALPAAGLSLLFGRLGDLCGLRRMFLLGLALLASSSLLGGIAAEPVLLLSARALQGVATAMTGPAALALLITAFADERQRARALGLNGALLSGGFTFGALVGGMLVDVLNWRWAFFINVPISLAILAVAPLVIPAVPRRNGIRLDVPGAISVTFGLVAVVYGFTEKSLVSLMIGAAALAVFFRIERRAKAPLVAIEMLAWPSVRWGNIAVLTIFSMEAGLIYLVTIYLQKVLHLGPFATGLVFGVPGLASIVAGVVAGRIVARRGARPVLLFALLAQGGFTAPLIFLGSDPNSMWLLVPALFVGFFGHITAVVAATVAATSGVPDASKGLASGLMTTCQRVASTIGIPALAAIMMARADLLGGVHVALAADVVFTVTAVALIAVGLKQVRPIQIGGSGPV
ncbi:MFS transporter [Burkholderia multivorans]|uniref:MFS transporter n=1 Tax=Burkholderia multivorans TaxID=87883 RepID=UPI001C6123E6|nr:MFS transporter [Burkholderia multivorans]